jgi:ubiquinone/menaquinone biosynthesis C-methylase UbiE
MISEAPRHGSPSDPRVGFFDDRAQEWDRQPPIGGDVIGRLVAIEELLALSAGQELLEVGCGTGQITGWLAEQVRPGRVTAVDFSPAMLAVASAKGIDADFRRMDACCDDFGQARYDVILCFHSFPHFRDQTAALRTLGKALKTNGRLLIVHLVGSTRINAFHSTVEGPVRGDCLPQGGAWKKLLEGAALRVSRFIDIDELFFLEATGAVSESV